MANENLGAAKKAKNDEFYTQYADIEKEMNAYLDYDKNVFKDKTILLPCDDPEWSNFTKYFAQNFEKLGLKKLISTSYAPNSKNIDDLFPPTEFELGSDKYDKSKSESNGRIFTLTKDTNKDKRIDFQDIEWDYLSGDGDFRSDELKKLRDEADMVITNPPFSLFRAFLTWVYEGKKQFVIIGNMNAITYREAFSLLKNNEIWLGATSFNRGMYFRVPGSFIHSKTYKFDRELNGEKVNRVPGVCWFTNLEHGRRHQPLQLMSMERNLKFSKHKEIKERGYKTYDNYDAIEVAFIDAIPSDHKGEMGVPITFLDKYNPDQFEIIGSFNAGAHGDELGSIKVEISINGKPSMWNGPVVDGMPVYKRIVIKHRKPA
jgi:hypothetical protein